MDPRRGEREMNYYFQKIKKALQNHGNDENMAHAIGASALILLRCLKNDTQFESHKDFCDTLMAKLCLETIDNYPSDKHSSNMRDLYAWPVFPVPHDVFNEDKKESIPIRKEMFYAHLKVGDILEGVVLIDENSSYIIKVLHKYGFKLILGDLDIKVSLIQTPGIDNELLKGDYCRVAVYEIKKENDVRKISVTMDRFLLNKECPRELKKISHNELPSYILNPPEANFYADYINTSLSFHNHLLLKKLYTDFGINVHKSYSFYPRYANLHCDGEYLAESILKKSKVKDITKYLSKALCERQNGNYEKALQSVNVALELDPNYIRSYEIRALIYTDKALPKESQEAYSDYCKILNLDENNNDAKKHISKIIFKAANKFYKSKLYIKAAEAVEKAIEYNQSNQQAVDLKDYLKKKHPESFLDCTDENTLIAVKEGLVAQLKQLE